MGQGNPCPINPESKGIDWEVNIMPINRNAIEVTNIPGLGTIVYVDLAELFTAQPEIPYCFPMLPYPAPDAHFVKMSQF